MRSKASMSGSMHPGRDNQEGVVGVSIGSQWLALERFRTSRTL